MPYQQLPPMPPPVTPWQPVSTNCAGGHHGNQQLNSVVGPNFTMPAMPKMPAVPSPSPEVVDADLMTLLRQDVADLPPHIQKVVKETAMKDGVKEGAKAIKDLEKAGKNLGHARKAFEQAIMARSQLHKNWRQFLSDAVLRLWQDYAVQFTEQERKLQEQVMTTREAFHAAKHISAKAHQIAGTVQEIHSDEEFGEITTAPSASAVQITESMEGLSKSLQDLQQQAAAIPPEEEIHTAKRPRVTPKEPDAAMREAPGDSPEPGRSSSPFQQAGCK